MKSNNFFHPPPQQPSLPPHQPPQPQVWPGKSPSASQGQDPQGPSQHSERFIDDFNSVNVKESSITVLSGALNYIGLSAIEACNALDLLVDINTGENNTGANPNSGNEGGPDANAGKGSGGSIGKGKGTPSKSVPINNDNNDQSANENSLEGIFKNINTKAKDLEGIPPESTLNIEDFATIFSYTMESNANGVSSIYKTINKALAQRAADRTLEGGGYILNLITAIRKLPQDNSEELYRGVCGHINEMNLKPGSILSWPAFTSTTSEREVAMGFIDSGKIDPSQGEGRYLFVIGGDFHGYDISQFSDFKMEKGKQT